MINNCFVCENEDIKTIDSPETRTVQYFECEDCGRYGVTHTALVLDRDIIENSKKYFLSKILGCNENNCVPTIISNGITCAKIHDNIDIVNDKIEESTKQEMAVEWLAQREKSHKQWIQNSGLQGNISKVKFSEMAEKMFLLTVPNDLYRGITLEEVLDLDNDAFEKFCDWIRNKTGHIIEGVPTKMLVEEITEMRKTYILENLRLKYLK